VKPRHPYGVFAVCWLVFFALVLSLCAQEATAPKHTGVPQDWSQRHIVFSRDALALHPDLIYREPRVLHQAMQRWQAPNSDVFHGADRLPTSADNSGPHRDWNVKLGGRIVANMFPAKFSFDPGAPPDCTKDYVVFGLATAGVTGGPANLVAFNNLYSDPVKGGGLCDPPSGPGLGPNVRFAYFITTVARGRISTSPILSLDGTKIAFVESIPGTSPSAVFHVLTWTGGEGTISVPAVPKSMTSLTFSPTANSTTSSPWIDYSNDTVYLGADNGVVYKITGVFKGKPTLTRDGFWPVTVSAGFHLTPPVLDSALGMLMVGSTNGNLYRIDTAKDLLATLLVGKGTSHGILAAPIVDITNGTTFVVSANDFTSAVLVEIDTASMTLLSKARIGQGSAGGTKLKLYEPAFSNDYYNDPSTGLIRLCGTGAADTTPWQYAFGFTGRTMKTTPSFSQQLLPSTGAGCTGWTEFFNPYAGGSTGTEFFFFGLDQDCTGAGKPFGCVAEITDVNTTPIFATVNAGPSGIVVDNYSTATQASSIYLSAVTGSIVYKFTQNGLQ
jgi:hypothetical protein